MGQKTYVVYENDIPGDIKKPRIIKGAVAKWAASSTAGGVGGYVLNNSFPKVIPSAMVLSKIGQAGDAVSKLKIFSDAFLSGNLPLISNWTVAGYGALAVGAIAAPILAVKTTYKLIKSAKYRKMFRPIDEKTANNINGGIKRL